MKSILLKIPVIAFLATPVAAQEISYPLACTGSDPDWSLILDAAQGEFDFQRLSNLDVVLDTTAQGADWPRAITLIGRGDSAIVILENTVCEIGNLSARILTQRGETPIFLTGCCQISEN